MEMVANSLMSVWGTPQTPGLASLEYEKIEGGGLVGDDQRWVLEPATKSGSRRLPHGYKLISASQWTPATAKGSGGGTSYGLGKCYICWKIGTMVRKWRVVKGEREMLSS